MGRPKKDVSGVETKEVVKPVEASEVTDSAEELTFLPEEILKQMTKDLKKVFKTRSKIGTDELRFLSDTYYQVQQYRIASCGQIRSIEQNSDTAQGSYGLSGIADMFAVIEDTIKAYIDIATDLNNTGRWLKSIKGIGPTLAGSFLSYFDVTKAKSFGAFQSYAGENNNEKPWWSTEQAKLMVANVVGKDEVITDTHIQQLVVLTKWKFDYLDKNSRKCTRSEANILKALAIYAPKINAKEVLKGITKDTKSLTPVQIKVLSKETGVSVENLEKYCYSDTRDIESLRKCICKIPYNADLKVTCWKAGQQFVKVSGNADSLYGRIYRQKKAELIEQNEQGLFAETAAAILESKKLGKTTDAYKAYSEGKLPKAHIQARAERYAVKLFIAHLYEQMYWDEYKKSPAVPYPIAFQGHVEYIGPEVPFIY